MDTSQDAQANIPSPLDVFLAQERRHMLTDLKRIVRDCKMDIRQDRSLYKESPDSEPSIDVRLCVDSVTQAPAAFFQSFTWIFRTGDASYDQYHSMYCAASCIGLNTKAEELLKELCNGLE